VWRGLAPLGLPDVPFIEAGEPREGVEHVGTVVSARPCAWVQTEVQRAKVLIRAEVEEGFGVSNGIVVPGRREAVRAGGGLRGWEGRVGLHIELLEFAEALETAEAAQGVSGEIQRGEGNEIGQASR
jgi:hypothetical protein